MVTALWVRVGAHRPHTPISHMVLTWLGMCACKGMQLVNRIANNNVK